MRKHDHPNMEAVQLLNNTKTVTRLKRTKPSELIVRVQQTGINGKCLKSKNLAIQVKCKLLVLKHGIDIIIKRIYIQDSQNAFAIATFPKTAITGTSTMEDPSSAHMSTNPKVLFPTTVENGGSWNGGSPDLTCPENSYNNIQTLYKQHTNTLHMFNSLMTSSLVLL